MNSEVYLVQVLSSMLSALRGEKMMVCASKFIISPRQNSRFKGLF